MEVSLRELSTLVEVTLEVNTFAALVLVASSALGALVRCMLHILVPSRVFQEEIMLEVDVRSQLHILVTS